MEGEGTDIGFSDVALPGGSKRFSSRVMSGLWLKGLVWGTFLLH